MREPIRIAYLEDSPEQGTAVAGWLEAQAMQCYVYETADKLKEALETSNFDAIMLDVDINGETAGLAMLDHIRQTCSDNTPILMVSAESHWQAALTSGADDFLEKPLNAKTVLVHLHRVLRPVAQASTIENYPPFQLNATHQQVLLEGSPVDLTDDEFELASTLFRHFGKVLSYNQLMDTLSSERSNGSARKVESELLKLKRKMNLRDIDGWRLESVYRHGCRLVNAQYDPA